MLYWNEYLRGYGLPIPGLLKFGQPIDPADPDAAAGCTLAKAQEMFALLKSAFVAQGLDGNYQLVDAVATKAMPQYTMSVLAIPGDPNGKSVFLVSAMLATTRDLVVTSGDKTLSIPKGTAVQVNEVMGNLAARGSVTIQPGEYPLPGSQFDKNRRQINGGTQFAEDEVFPTALAITFDPPATNSSTPTKYEGNAFWIAG